MGRVYTKYFNGFTVSVLHDSSQCIRCKMLCTFYTKMKNKVPPWDREDARKVDNACAASKYKFFGVISYLNTYIRIEYIPYEEYKHNLELHVPIASIELVNGEEIRYFRETTVEERIIITRQISRTYPSFRSELGPKNIEKEAPKNSSPKTVFSYRGYRKVIKNAVKRSIIDRTRETNTERTLKDRIIHCKKIRKAKKVKDLHKVQNPSSKSLNDKEPGKGTLKRKRWYLEKLKNNDGYEDDIFEEKNFYSFQNMLDDEEDSNSSDVKNMATPKWSISLSPRERSESPTYEDCYSPEELSVSRKEAEEYQFRRFKRRKTMLLSDKNRVSSQKIKSESPDSSKVLESVCRILMQQPKAEKDSGSESEDSYFTDSSEDET